VSAVSLLGLTVGKSVLSTGKHRSRQPGRVQRRGRAGWLQEIHVSQSGNKKWV